MPKAPARLGFLLLSVHRRALNQAASDALMTRPADCVVAQHPPHSITSSALMEIEALFVAAGDNVISPLPVALVERCRRARWYPPGTPDSLAARKAKVLHQVNSVIAQSKIRRRPVDRFYARHFDLRQGPCRRFGRPHRRRLLRMCCKRPCRRGYASEQPDELAPLHSITSSGTYACTTVAINEFPTGRNVRRRGSVGAVVPPRRYQSPRRSKG
jgi:hypothetical protein